MLPNGIINVEITPFLSVDFDLGLQSAMSCDEKTLQPKYGRDAQNSYNFILSCRNALVVNICHVS